MSLFFEIVGVPNMPEYAINYALCELLEEFNDQPMKDYGYQTRRERFDKLDKPYAQKLPAEPFRIISIEHDVLVRKNYHVFLISIITAYPFELTNQRVTVRHCGMMVEIIHDNQIITRHTYSTYEFRYTTKKEHMPDAHQFVKGLTPGWIIAQAAKVSQSTVDVVSKVVKRNEHVQQRFNSALGILQLGRVYTPQRLELACQRCIHFKCVSYHSIKSLLVNNLEVNTIATELWSRKEHVLVHENLRRDFSKEVMTL